MPTKPYQFRLKISTMLFLEELAKEKIMKVSSLIEQAVEDFVETQDCSLEMLRERRKELAYNSAKKLRAFQKKIRQREIDDFNGRMKIISEELRFSDSAPTEKLAALESDIGLYDGVEEEIIERMRHAIGELKSRFPNLKQAVQENVENKPKNGMEG